jgi:hypothetical protein
MTGERAPIPVARLGVALAARALPARPDRERYAAEFLAELHGLSPTAQLRHAAGVLSQALALRAALGGSPSRGHKEAAMTPTIPAGQRFRCRYMRWHHWRTFSNPDGERYVACAVCRKEHTGWDTVPRNALSGM